ncbi:glycosyltransferase family 2 protein [Sporomusa sphaeroides]|uniref:Glycosyltransferase EpsE n=1 Tax=Sporomusa sphaeroides DSM 2875 TaxID=1337886 RepID=A0ABM9W455_9FIRM|nr:glycosyltransferase [Sporomusa sphaeroides]OLS55532.1 putative glycosyltransferase EpsE [Sporomusa sphaeroides DSM 2875]CVK19931.1 Putative glycosyltransferase EpsE [Sporomusa sphaeroides DSM 2875]
MEQYMLEWETDLASKCPKVTVLMSVYNGEQYLREAIESILKQSYKNFELLIINDASTDTSRSIIQSYSDPRIRLIDNEVNLGLTVSLNKGIALSQGEYIARMDSDDISLDERLEKQVQFMKEHSDIGVCGSWVETFGVRHEIWQYPIEHNEITSRLLFYNSLAHSTVIFRRNLLCKLGLCYNEEYRYSQDYELWIRCSGVVRLANIPEPLVKYRLSENQIGRKHNDAQIHFADRARKLLLSQLGVELTDEFYEIHKNICNRKFPVSLVTLKRTQKWLRILSIKSFSVGSETVHVRTLVDVWFSCCINAIGTRWLALWGFLTLGLSEQKRATFYKRSIQLLLNCIR